MTQVSKASRRARGLHRLEVWLPEALIRKLDEICEASGYSRAEIVGTMIQTDWDEWQELTWYGPKRVGK